MWEETSLKLEQICDGCHCVHFPHWIIQLLASIPNDLSTGCSEWLSPAVPPLNQMLWGAYSGIFLCCNGVNSHWVITLASYFFPLSFPPYLNVYSFPPWGWDPVLCWPANGSAHRVYLELKVVDFGPRMHAIYHLGGFRCLPDSRSLLAALNRKWNQWLGQRDLIAA